MPTYREKPVEAFQITEDTRFDQENWPEWLKEAWMKEPSEEGSYHETGTGLMLIQTLRGYEPVSNGDWVIEGLTGRLHRYTNEEFEQYYEPVGATKKAEKTKPKADPKEEVVEKEGVDALTTQGMRKVGRKTKKS